MSERAPGRVATVEDVAARAGVSVATVSRALRGLPNVAAVTRERVMTAAAELRYRPDPNASRLAAGRSHAIGVAMPLLGQWYFGQILAGVEAVLAPAGFDLLVYSAASPAERRRFLGDALPVRKRVDGLVLVDLPLPEPDVAAWSASGVHLVTVGQRTSAFPSVQIDEARAAALAVEHLVGLGHVRIGLIGVHGRDDHFRFTVPSARAAGYETAMRAAGIELDRELEVDGDYTVDGGRAGMEALLAHPEPPTAVVALSDEMALGAMHAAQAHGLRIPDELSIVGIDDHEMAPAVGLTTVRQPVADIGGRAAQLLLDELDGRVGDPPHLVIATHLVERTSTGPRQGRRRARRR